MSDVPGNIRNMTNTPLQTPDQPQPVPQQQYQQPPVAPKKTNVLGMIALIVAGVGFIFACIPGALIVGWVLLPIGFILALVSLFMKGKGKALGIAALIVAVVGTVVGVVVFLAAVSTAVDEAFGGGETTIEVPTSDDEATEDEADPADDQGTRTNPYPIGTAITQGDWTVTINSVNLDANAEVTADNMFNEEPDEGMTYILVNMTATYNGTDPDGATPWVTVEYVTPEGNTIDTTSKFAVAPDEFDIMSTVYEGASVTGNKVLQVPAATATEGVLAVTPSMMGDKVFVAVQ